MEKTTLLNRTALLLVLLSGGIAVNAQVCTPAPSGLVSWWQGEGGAQDFAGGNGGTLNSVTFAAGKVGQAFDFNGTNAYVEVVSSSNLKPTNSFSVEAWVKYNRITDGGGSGAVIISKGNESSGPTDWALAISDNHKLRPHAYINGSGWWYFDCADWAPMK